MKRVCFVFSCFLMGLSSSSFGSEFRGREVLGLNGDKSWIFFDLGNTLINTNGTGFRYMKGAKRYLETLRAKGFKIGVISNIPQSFGNSQIEKLGTLKKYVAKKWNGSDEMEWELFDKVLLPPSDARAKPHPHLFLQAKGLEKSCAVFFQGENKTEVDTAAKLGMKSYQVGSGEEFYIPLDTIETLYEALKSKTSC